MRLLDGASTLINKNISIGSSTPVALDTTPAPASGGGGGGGCFIATAAYGSYLNPHVVVLRDFRDRHLLTNQVGRAFVEFYYTYSPALADITRKREALRTGTRMMLTPVICAIQYPLIPAGVLFVGCIAVIAILVRRKNISSKYCGILRT